MSDAKVASRSLVDLPDDGSWSLNIREDEPETRGGTPSLPPLDRAGRTPIRRLSAELGHDASTVLRTAKRLGCLLEKRWVVDGKGVRQMHQTTDPAGAEALRRWFAR
jgi:hypothetical protein